MPIIPTSSSGDAVGTLAQGATGAFNAYYMTLAQTLVAGGQSNAYLRLGWEFDGSWMPWAATSPSAESNFAAVLPADRDGDAVRRRRALPLRLEP